MSRNGFLGYIFYFHTNLLVQPVTNFLGILSPGYCGYFFFHLSGLQLSIESIFANALVLHRYTCDWLKNVAPLSHPIRSKTKPIITCSHAFSRALRQLHICVSSSDYFSGLSASVFARVITLVLVLRHSNVNRSMLHLDFPVRPLLVSQNTLFGYLS